jgi:prophage antirepressor-like protein
MDIIKTFVIDQTSHSIDILYKNDEPVFRADQIGKVLELKNVRDAIKNFDVHQKGVVSTDTAGGMQNVNILTEDGVYELLFQSRKPIAKVFRTWVCTVLKEIRDKGKYDVDEQLALIAAEKAELLKQKEDFAKEKEIVIEEKTEQKAIFEKATEDLAWSRHKGFIDTFDNQAVVYIAQIKKDLEPGKHIIKIGASDNLRGRASNLKQTFGGCLILQAYQCNLNYNFEGYLQQNSAVKRFRYKEVIFNDKKSSETFLMTDENIKQLISIAGRNVNAYKTKSKMDEVRQMFDVINQKLDDKNAVDDIDAESDDDPEKKLMTSVVLGKRSASTEDDVEYETRKKQRGFCSKDKQGHKIQRYSEDGSNLLMTYQSMIDVTRDSIFTKPINTNTLLSSARSGKVYYKYRWALLDRDMPDDTVQELDETTGISFERCAYAELDVKQNEILATHASLKAISTMLNLATPARLCNAVKAGKVYGNRIYKRWPDCSEELKNAFIENGGILAAPVDNKNKRVAQIDPETGKTVRVWETRNAIIQSFHISAKVLRTNIASSRVFKGFVWRDVFD